jgi:SAM-dependent methyltransferase
VAPEDLAGGAYHAALERLDSFDRRLAVAAWVVNTLHPEVCDIGNALLDYAERRYPGRDVIADYVARAEALAILQQRFDADPSPRTLGSAGATIDRDVYNLALLLSIPFTNHRFEIMQQLQQFLGACESPTGRIASIGTGTGYELRLMAALPAEWIVESYDIEKSVQHDARDFLRHFDVTRPVQWGGEFPLHTPPAEFRGRYDAIVMCELLEHLSDPAAALTAVRECLAPGGRAFVTMAVNIAQEDHVYLYPDLESCRRQIGDANLRTHDEWITPQTTLVPPEDRQRGFRKGNYIAVVSA